MNSSFGKRNTFSSQHSPENSNILGSNGPCFLREEFPNYKKEGKRAMFPVLSSFPSLHILSKDVHENLLSLLFMKLVNATFAFGSKQTL